jgi:uncharacterized protein (TIGR02186 family)
MIWKIAFLFLLLGFLPNSAMAQRTRLAAALIDDAVLLTSSFNGTKLTMFGAVELAGEKSADIVIVVRGPNRPAWISRKKRVAGLWIGQNRLYFDAAPTYFGLASTRPIDEIAPRDTQRLYGLNAISQLNPKASNYSKSAIENFKTAFVNQRTKQKLYLSSPNGVRMVGNGLFRADINLPDLTPPGLYTVKVIVMKNNRPVDTTLQTFEVKKVGAERWIYKFAIDHAVLHGLLGLALALGAGFTSARIFRRMTA